MNPHRQRMNDLAAEYASTDDALGWFDRLYTTAGGDASTIPWADLRPNPNFVQWAEAHGLHGDNFRQRALVVGCGLGDDAEALSTIGFSVTAFDISPAAIDWAKQRFTSTRVSYVVADLLQPPPDWRSRYDFVLEAYTLQVLPPALLQTAMQQLATLVSPGGTLLLITRARNDDEPLDGKVPSKLSRNDLCILVASGLTELKFEDYWEKEDPPVRRLRVTYRRTAKP